MAKGAKPGRRTSGKGAKNRPARQICGMSIANRREQKAPQLIENKAERQNSIANFSTSAALTKPKFFAACRARFTAFLTGTQTQTGFALTHSKQTTVVLSNRYKICPPQGSFCFAFQWIPEAPGKPRLDSMRPALLSLRHGAPSSSLMTSFTERYQDILYMALSGHPLHSGLDRWGLSPVKRCTKARVPHGKVENFRHGDSRNPDAPNTLAAQAGGCNIFFICDSRFRSMICDCIRA